jgi:Uma2 family endonuclease
MSLPTATGLTYDDLRAFPDDGLRRELIDGELHVSPAPGLRHQASVLAIGAALRAHVREHGGAVYVAPTDVRVSDRTVVEPDVLMLSSDRASHQRSDAYIDVVPDLVVEVSSPSTRRLDLVRKRALYERERVPEYWFVDLEADVVDVYRLDASGRYGEPTTVGVAGELTCLAAPGLSLPVGEALDR